MRRLDERYVHTATDLNNYTECRHLIALERDVAAGLGERPERDDPTAELIRQKGDEHERRFFQRMRDEHGAALIAIDSGYPRDRADYEAAERSTRQAMANGAPVVFQAAFFDGTFFGRADFLQRVERPSQRWPWSYEVVDTKLALSPKPHFLVQLAHYSEHVARLQGVAPVDAAIVLGTGEVRRFRVETFAPYYRRLKASYLASFAAREDAYPFECAHCDLCAWRDACAGRRDRDDHLSLVATIRRDQIERLEGEEIRRLSDLATAPNERRPKRMSARTFENLRAQAAEQHRYRSARAIGRAEHSYTFRPFEDGAGFARLPAPQPGDVFFDVEGDPLYRPGLPLEYLFGCFLPDEPDGRYRAFWGTTPGDERTAFEAFVDFVVERRRRYPDLHVYHYAPYETTALKRLACRFGSREEAIDDLLRAGTFVDLYPIVRQSMWISQPSYSIKKVEALYGFFRTTRTRGGDDSIVMFEAWLESQDPAVLEDIRAYNEDDCRSTFELREWLVARRAELLESGAATFPWRPAPESRDPGAETETEAAKSAARRAVEAERRALETALLDGAGTPASEEALRAWPEERRARWLLGNVLNYHHREAKSEYWEFFDRCDRPTEMTADRQALGGLELLREIPPYASGRSSVYTYAFPEQEHELGPGMSPADADSRRGAGTIVAIDDGARRLEIRLARAVDPEKLRALVPPGPLKTDAHAAELAAIGRAYLAGRLARESPATDAILLRRAPTLEGRAAGATVQPEVVSREAVSSIVRALRGSALVVQGPPGTGKTTAGAGAIVDLLSDGKRVALVALSHAALHNLCHKVEAVAAERRVPFAGCHRQSDTNAESRFRSRSASPRIEDANAESATTCDLVSMTSYGWAGAMQRDPDLARGFDVLVIDEAGQISLADALIVSRLAPAVVLLGDPQQLPQVKKGTHPIGTDVSVLEHLLGDDATVRTDRGIFLERSYRLEPRVAEFVSRSFYDGRLFAANENARNRIASEGPSGGGLRFVDVAHDVNARRSPEEAERIADAIARLLGGGTTTLRGGSERLLAPRDVLVVTPYNAQRAEILRRLGQRGLTDVAVGTVDKFQGQEAPVVFYSMATSTAELAPRGLDFLLSPNRFNVAISRAEALAVVLCSPALLSSGATSIENVRLLSLLCAYVENATPNPARAAEQVPLPLA